MTRMDKDGNIFQTRGDNFKLSLINVKENGVLINWAGWHAKIQVRESPNSQTTVLTLTETDGIDLSVAGKLLANKPGTSTNFIPKTYYHDIQITRPNGEVETWFRAKKFYLEEDVAR